MVSVLGRALEAALVLGIPAAHVVQTAWFDERTAGLGSFFTSASAGALDSLVVEDGLAIDEYVDTPAELPEPAAGRWRLLRSLASRCIVEALDALAAADETSLMLTRLFLGDTPITNLERGVDGLTGTPAADLLEALSWPFVATYESDGTQVHAWPAVAAPGTDWANLTDVERVALDGIYGPEIIDESIDFATWMGWYVEIGDDGRWRFFGRALS